MENWPSGLWLSAWVLWESSPSWWRSSSWLLASPKSRAILSRQLIFILGSRHEFLFCFLCQFPLLCTSALIPIRRLAGIFLFIMVSDIFRKFGITAQLKELSGDYASKNTLQSFRDQRLKLEDPVRAPFSSTMRRRDFPFFHGSHRDNLYFSHFSLRLQSPGIWLVFLWWSNLAQYIPTRRGQRHGRWPPHGPDFPRHNLFPSPGENWPDRTTGSHCGGWGCCPRYRTCLFFVRLIF